MSPTLFSHALITGASSGIGAALARTLAASGLRLTLTGRNDARLKAVAADCKTKGADVAAVCLDVCDRDAMAALVADSDALAPLDLVVANAGISAGTGSGGESEQQTRRLFAVNVEGVFNTVFPAVERMRPRRRGQIGLVSSIAGFRGFPGAPAYCAAKAALKVWGEGLRGCLAHDGIGLSVILPGFVETALTADNRMPMPFLMKPEQAAVIIRRGLEKNRGRIAFPLPMTAAAWLAAALPDAVVDCIGRRLPEK